MDTDLSASAILPLIQERTGRAVGIQRTARGFSSDLTAIVECEKGPFFVKAVRNRPGGRRDSLIREREINAHLTGIAPSLLWDVVDDCWLVLGFEAVEGRSSDFAPGSPDLAEVADLVGRIGETPLPAVARGWAETRWDRFAGDSAEALAFRGDSLLHTDINPSNVLVGERTWAVDWAWPTRGAGFIDPALLVIQLIAAGHDPAWAEQWASRCPAWQRADTGAVDAFAAANLRMYRARAARKPEAPWLTAMVEACLAWSDHRGVATFPR
ncbi:protein kinase [Streptomyces sp. NPDC048182]|uniref:protein kinase n=1 Tax=Streptomyces sp. NPDC048182 TaxID=3365507 RepID=UPI003715EAEB